MNEEYLQEGPRGYGGPDRPPVPPGEQSPMVSLPRMGDERVDDAVAGLSRLPGLPADEHVTVLEEVHGRLRDILGELSEGNMGPGRPDRGAPGEGPP